MNTDELVATQDNKESAGINGTEAADQNTASITEKEDERNLLKTKTEKLIEHNKPAMGLLQLLFGDIKDPITHNTNITLRPESDVAEVSAAVVFAEEFLRIKASKLNITHAILLSNNTIVFDGLEVGNCHNSYIIGKEILFNNSKVNPDEFGNCTLLGEVVLMPSDNSMQDQNNSIEL